MTDIEFTMSRTPFMDVWHPQTQLERDAILRELEAVLASPHFSNSKRYPALLQYIVEKTLKGESDELKERTLGVEVFDRSPSYDTNADTVVRYTAGEVRKRLSLYYYELERKPTIQISLPAGSYVPEFIHTGEVAEEVLPAVMPPEVVREALTVHEPATIEPTVLPVVSNAPMLRVRFGVGLAVVAALILVLAATAGWAWRSHRSPVSPPVSAFWAPILHDQPTVLVCTGGSVFAQNNFSGVMTAGKDSEYPFVSMQTASAIGRLSGLVEVSGSTTRLQGAASTPLSDLREHSVILLGGYNNPWTRRLLQPLRYHFTPESPNASIMDSQQPSVAWGRDRSLPYSSADDYALIARFHNTVTDGWVVALAGVGRNGTEAAAQFVTSPHYLQLLKDSLGSDFGNRNIEVVLKVNVIDGKTGAPTILASHSW
jgi:hypothetical protein